MQVIFPRVGDTNQLQATKNGTRTLMAWPSTGSSNSFVPITSIKYNIIYNKLKVEVTLGLLELWRDSKKPHGRQRTENNN